MNTVVTTGCFDILHSGHLRHLRECREQGDSLIVLLDSDARVKRSKGPLRPVVPEDEREAILNSIRHVDLAIVFDTDDDIERIIRVIHPVVLGASPDYLDKRIVGREIVESYGGRIHITGGERTISTTKIIERIRGSNGIGQEGVGARGDSGQRTAVLPQAAGY